MFEPDEETVTGYVVSINNPIIIIHIDNLLRRGPGHAGFNVADIRESIDGLPHALKNRSVPFQTSPCDCHGFLELHRILVPWNAVN